MTQAPTINSIISVGTGTPLRGDAPSLTTFDIADKIQQAAAEFLSSSGSVEQLPGTRGLKYHETIDGSRFFGIPKGQQVELDFAEVKLSILQKLGLSPDTPTLQIVGDSARFSEKGTAFAKDFLERFLNEKDQLILWGSTANGKKGDSTFDVNQLISNWLEEDPIRFKKALANVVDFHSCKAIRDWKCSISVEIKNFYLVYDNACFGDDVLSSDSITDKGVCLEGGIQSFRQSITFLSRDVDVYGIYNLRGPENPATRDPGTGEYICYFSAAEFLDVLSKNLIEDAQAAEFYKNQYFETHHLFNPHRPDSGTKQALFDAGWKQFLDEKLWLKLDKCHFERFMGQ